MVKKIVIGLLLVIVAIQFYRPEKNISIETPDTDFLVVNGTDANLAATIKASCYDCHSNNTAYPWYAEVAPVSWWVANHVNDGKKHFNFSIWDTYSDKKKDHKLEENIEMIEEKEMPLESYLPMHPEAKLSEEQQKELIAYFKEVKLKINYTKVE
ncbi:heme-binding domain-containing protein [Aureibaculum sp. A20]|uniref:Heme-binding domain-containing protein n=1 Tax=Aureibaculum flavum TaxID=2795986 RepID=A0ABS0WLU1_9FLAO|nr:heme-binding domain-containing protein [Aureibaculum flavum]MBJ2172940.1 heme-binding domain-containing protein [Aureibaculum flavum]